MFRRVPSKRSPRLYCAVCGFERKDVPEHHGLPMRWTLIGSFKKVEKFACLVCDYQTEVPVHCGIPMRFSEADYDDTPALTKHDYERTLESLREEGG